MYEFGGLEWNTGVLEYVHVNWKRIGMVVYVFMLDGCPSYLNSLDLALALWYGEKYSVTFPRPGLFVPGIVSTSQKSERPDMAEEQTGLVSRT